MCKEGLLSPILLQGLSQLNISLQTGPRFNYDGPEPDILIKLLQESRKAEPRVELSNAERRWPET